MKQFKSQTYFLFGFIAFALVLTFFIFKPFLYASILAVVFATIFYPIYKIILKVTKQNKGLSAISTTILVVVVFLVPLILLTTQIFKESTSLYSSMLNNGGFDNLSALVTNQLNGLNNFLPTQVDFSLNINQYLKSGLNWLVNNLGFIFSNAIAITGGCIVFFIALYYLFKDGEELKKNIIRLSPLDEEYNQLIFKKMSIAINSVVKGTLLIAILQGALTSLGFFIFGIPNAVLWGTVTTFTALMPWAGTGLIIVPAAIYLFLNSNLLHFIGFAIWGITIVGFIDNLLKPKLIERGIMIHPVLILLSVLGGISFFGAIGFLLGPLILSLLFVLFEIYSMIKKKE
ncbi:AI-2E family transporter [Candidatus Nomurabacteria bacterium]|nr:AI-2E family transporter [Candidatus Nomurabacteria bacterium]